MDGIENVWKAVILIGGPDKGNYSLFLTARVQTITFLCWKHFQSGRVGNMRFGMEDRMYISWMPFFRVLHVFRVG